VVHSPADLATVLLHVATVAENFQVHWIMVLLISVYVMNA